MRISLHRPGHGHVAFRYCAHLAHMLLHEHFGLRTDPALSLEVFCQAVRILWMGWWGSMVNAIFLHATIIRPQKKQKHPHSPKTPLLQAGRSALQRNLERRKTQSQTSPSRICLGRLYNTAAMELGTFTKSGNMLGFRPPLDNV